MTSSRTLLFVLFFITFFIIGLGICLFGHEYVSYYVRAEKLAFSPVNTVFAGACGIAFASAVLFTLLARFAFSKMVQSGFVLLAIFWILVLGSYKGLKLPNIYETDRYRHIQCYVTGIDGKQQPVTDVRHSVKLRDIPLHPQNTFVKKEHYEHVEIRKRDELPLKLRFAAGNLESKTVDIVPVQIYCYGNNIPEISDTLEMKTDNNLVFYDVKPHYNRVVVEVPAVSAEPYPSDDHVNLRIFSNCPVSGIEAIFVNIGKCSLGVLVLFTLIAPVCVIFNVSPLPSIERIEFWKEVKNIARHIGQDAVGLCRYFWLKRWLILISCFIGLICLGIACWNYSRMPEFPTEHKRADLWWAARMIWSFTSLIAFLIINNWRKADRIFWGHFIGWSVVFLLHWLVVNPGYFSADSYYSIAAIISPDRNYLTLWGSAMGLNRLLAMIAVSQVPYWGFFVVLQALFTALIIGIISSFLNKVMKCRNVLYLLNVLLFVSIPFQCYTLALVRETPYCLFLWLASITLFLLVLKNKEKLKTSDWFIGVIAVFCLTQFRTDGQLGVVAFFTVLLLRLILCRSSELFYSNFLRPMFCFVLIATVATLWIGQSKENTSKYGLRILKEAGIINLLVNPDIKDSDPDQTNFMRIYAIKWDKLLRERRSKLGISTSNLVTNGNNNGFQFIDTRLIYENPIPFLLTRIEIFFTNANMYGHGHYGIRDDRAYTGQNFPWRGNTIDYARQTGLIPMKTGYPQNKLFKVDNKIRKYHSPIPLRVSWSFLPCMSLCLLALLLYSYFPATAAVSCLVFSLFPPIFCVSPLFNPIYYLFIFYGGLLILPLAVFEFRYRRLQRTKV